jgi:hypothetical protein
MTEEKSEKSLSAPLPTVKNSLNKSLNAWNHPKFVKAKGCVAYRREDENIRDSIGYGSESFKKIYNFRTIPNESSPAF